MSSGKKYVYYGNGLAQRGNSWYAIWTVDGLQHRKALGSDRKQAEAINAELQSKLKQGRAFDSWTGLEQLVRPPNKQTVAEAAQSYMDGRAGAKASTITTYTDILNTHILPVFGDCEVRKIDEDAFNAFRKRLIGQRLSARRINSICSLLGSILDTCKRKKVISDNPYDAVDRLQEPKADVDPLSFEELETALSHVDPHYRPLFTCLAWTGARPNELLALRWKNVDWRGKYLRIKLGRVRGQEGLPKTSSSQRDIPMLPPVVESLEHLKDGKVVSLDAYVFTDKKAQPINKHLDRIWARALKSARMRHRPSYQLRHTFASLALEQGASPAWVSNVLGHGDMQITFRHYARFIKSTAGENLRLMSDLFSKPAQAQEGGA